MSKDEAYKILRKEKPNNKTIDSYELSDRFVFIDIPKKEDPALFTCACTYIYKKDGSIGYGYPTAAEMKGAIR